MLQLVDSLTNKVVVSSVSLTEVEKAMMEKDESFFIFHLLPKKDENFKKMV